MKTRILLAITIMLGLGITSLQAQPMRAKSSNEERRINHGMRNGELTRGEYRRLEHEQKGIRHDRRNYRTNDGRISHRERKHLRHEQRRASRHIHHAKHNRHSRF